MPWIRPAGGSAKELTGDAGGWTGYLKVRESPTITSSAVKEQNRKFRRAANACEGKSQSDFRECMSDKL